MPRITAMFCFAVSDKDDDDEGVPAIINKQLGTVPLVGADLKRVESLMPLAQELADRMGKPIRIYKFTQKEQIGEIIPAEQTRLK